ncbi:MAG: hypothetical protein ABH829_05550 [archaeon]
MSVETPITLLKNSCVPIDNGILLWIFDAYDWVVNIQANVCKGWISFLCGALWIILFVIILFFIGTILNVAGGMIGMVTDRIFKPDTHIMDFFSNLWAPMKGIMDSLPGMQGFLAGFGEPTAPTKISTAICGGCFGLLALMAYWPNKFGWGLITPAAFGLMFCIGTTLIPWFGIMRIFSGLGGGILGMVLVVSGNWGAAMLAVIAAMLLIRVILPTEVGLIAGGVSAVFFFALSILCVFIAILPIAPALLDTFIGEWIMTLLRLGLRMGCGAQSLAYFG